LIKLFSNFLRKPMDLNVVCVIGCVCVDCARKFSNVLLFFVSINALSELLTVIKVSESSVSFDGVSSKISSMIWPVSSSDVRQSQSLE